MRRPFPALIGLLLLAAPPARGAAVTPADDGLGTFVLGASEPQPVSRESRIRLIFAVHVQA